MDQRELASRMTVLPAHLLEWQYPPASWCQLGSEHPRAANGSDGPPRQRDVQRDPGVDDVLHPRVRCGST